VVTDRIGGRWSVTSCNVWAFQVDEKEEEKNKEEEE